MSSYATVYLSDGRPVCSFRNDVDQLFLILFTKADWIELLGQEAYDMTRRNYPEERLPSEAVVMGFRTTASILRDRLDVTGVDLQAVTGELEHLVEERLNWSLDFGERYPIGSDDERKREIDALTAIDWKSWVSQLRASLAGAETLEQSNGREEVGSARWLMSMWDDHDPRYRLRALLEALADDEQITLDLADLIAGGWLDASVDPQSAAGDVVSYASLGGLAPIVLTEGSSDVEILTSAIRVRRPHLIGFIRFPDFNFRPEGGAAPLRQTIRAFASAGIPNRVVALFDNDTAARDVTRAIDLKGLPANLVVRHLPVLPLATSYPTLGPQGEHTMDVNGLAASIELFLGADVLTKEGVLRPIEWRGWVKGMRAYQGEIAEKGDIHDAFRAKVELATAHPESILIQDWSGIDLILDCIMESLRDAH